ncbi:DsbA family protein [Myxosarcina sp. GI1]|uniref:DsbA family protein n=1 Tax=Myxosarcina sp. GI1 TaxID=1541065 RepID=UPI0005654607|nr:DsbA family protein [Myxosarcina sp. GI1]
MNPASNNNKLSLSNSDRVRGNMDASIKLLEYGDYQCSQCGQLHRTLQGMVRQISESFCFAFRHFPQTQIHPQSQRAAEAAESAAAQGKFWQMHDTLFEHQQALDDSHLVEYANNLGLDIPQFLKALSEHVYINRVNEDIKSGRDNNVISTPTLFINGDRYIGAWDIESLLAAISGRSGGDR